MFDKLLKLAERVSLKLPVSRRQARLRRIRRRIRRAADVLAFRPKKPDRVSFVVGGAQKGGTTALDSYLREHPNICMGDQKEVNFFNNEAYFRRRRVNYNIYHAHFGPKTADCILGDASPDYLFSEGAVRRASEYDPLLKWIILLRNPIERAYSAWNMLRQRGMEKLSFREAIEAEPERCRRSWLPPEGTNRDHFAYLQRGFYGEQLRRLWIFFPKTQTLVLNQESLFRKPQLVLDEIATFLGIPRFTQVEQRVVHANPYISKIDNADWRYLKDVYEHDIKQLENMLGWDCTNWLEATRA